MRCSTCSAATASSVLAPHGLAARLDDHPIAVPLRAADRRAGHRDERRRRPAAALHRLARAERRGAGRLRDRLHRAVLDDHVDVGRPDGRGGDDRRTESRRRPSRARDPGRACRVAHRPERRGGRRLCCSSSFPHAAARHLRRHRKRTWRTIGEQLLRYLAVSGFFITLALVYTGGLQGTGDTRSPLFITLASQIAVPIGMCLLIQATRRSQASDIWLAIVLGHFTRCVLSVHALPPGQVAAHQGGDRGRARVATKIKNKEHKNRRPRNVEPTKRVASRGYTVLCTLFASAVASYLGVPSFRS